MRSGHYEVDADGNLVEVGAAAKAEGVAAEIGGASPARQPTPVPVRRALRVYGFAQLVSFTLLLAMVVANPDIRPVLIFVAIVYAAVAVVLHRLYRRALMRRFAKGGAA